MRLPSDHLTGRRGPEEVDIMRILVGSLGKLGFLVKDVTRGKNWSILPDEAALTEHLSAAFSQIELRDTLRRIRREGRIVFSCEDRRGAVLVGRLPSLV
jgi:hypothetical protein